jgi:hypothetical protein
MAVDIRSTASFGAYLKDRCKVIGARIKSDGTQVSWAGLRDTSVFMPQEEDEEERASAGFLSSSLSSRALSQRRVAARTTGVAL